MLFTYVVAAVVRKVVELIFFKFLFTTRSFIFASYHFFPFCIYFLHNGSQKISCESSVFAMLHANNAKDCS